MTYVSESFWHDAVNKATTDLFTFGYKHIVKPNFVFNHTPDVAHDQMIEFCRVTGNIPPLMWLLREMLNYTDPVLETSVMGVDFANPFGLSAGLDKNCDMPVLMDNAGFGFETVGSTTSRPCAGNPKPWFHRLPEYDSMMVHVGLANDGSDKVIARAEQAWTKARSLQVSVSIARTNDDLAGDIDEGIEDYRISLERAAGRSAMVEINVSCPNTRAGEPFTESPENLDRLFSVLDTVDRPQPTLVKMPGDPPRLGGRPVRRADLPCQQRAGPPHLPRVRGQVRHRRHRRRVHPGAGLRQDSQRRQPGHVHQLADVPRPAADHRAQARSGRPAQAGRFRTRIRGRGRRRLSTTTNAVTRPFTTSCEGVSSQTIDDTPSTVFPGVRVVTR